MLADLAIVVDLEDVVEVERSSSLLLLLMTSLPFVGLSVAECENQQ